MDYKPDNWVVLKISNEEEVLYKVLAGWSGGYTTGDSWRLNSGITSVEKQAYLYGFYGSSGSVYWCHQGSYGLRMNNVDIYKKLVKAFPDKVELMPEDTDWMGIELNG